MPVCVSIKGKYMITLEDEKTCPVCPDCGASIIVRTTAAEFPAPMQIGFAGVCAECGETVAVVYTHDEDADIEHGKTESDRNEKVEH